MATTCLCSCSRVAQQLCGVARAAVSQKRRPGQPSQLAITAIIAITMLSSGPTPTRVMRCGFCQRSNLCCDDVDDCQFLNFSEPQSGCQPELSCLYCSVVRRVSPFGQQHVEKLVKSLSEDEMARYNFVKWRAELIAKWRVAKFGSDAAKLLTPWSTELPDTAIPSFEPVDGPQLRIVNEDAHALLFSQSQQRERHLMVQQGAVQGYAVPVRDLGDFAVNFVEALPETTLNYFEAMSALPSSQSECKCQVVQVCFSS